MRKNRISGFTLVELIVVIAIIGVLAGLLIPSLLGYVRKSQIAASNSNAKSLSNAAATAMTELDTNGLVLVSDSAAHDFSWSKTDADAGTGANPTAQQAMAAAVRKYFSGVEQLSEAYYRVNSSAIVATAVCNNNYYGAHPHATETDETKTGYAKDTNFSDSEKLLDWGQNGTY